MLLHFTNRQQFNPNQDGSGQKQPTHQFYSHFDVTNVMN